MKPFIVLFFAAIAMLQPLSAQETPLFKILDQGMTGYIDRTGRVVIPAVYYNGGDFSEGLAAVRRGGYFGFIDAAGREVIPAVYDFARSFDHGVARAYKNGQVYFIDKNNELALDTAFADLVFINGYMAIVTTKTEKQGLMNMHTRKLLADTLFETIDGVYRNIVQVKIKGKSASDPWDRSYAVLDTMGNFIVPFEKYTQIRPFSDGYAVARGYKGGVEKNIVIDTEGKEIFERATSDQSYIYSSFAEGLARLPLQRKVAGLYSEREVSYEAFIDTGGKIVFADTTARYMQDFARGRSFVYCYGGYYLMNRSFGQVGTDTFTQVPENGFTQPYAIVKKQEAGYGIIDTNGVFVVAPKYERILETGLEDGFFFFAVQDQEGAERIGIGTLTGVELLQPVMQDVDRSGFHNGLLKAIIDNKLSYIDKSGKIAWQEKQAAPAAWRNRNIDFMERAGFYAYSEPDKQALGGYGSSRNYPQRVTRNHKFPPARLAVIVDTSKPDTLGESNPAWNVYVVNTTKGAKLFGAQDSRLAMYVQAKGQDGVWRDIEYLPRSSCGNSYHKLALKPGNFWAFKTAVYAGVYPAKFRIALRYLDPATTGKAKEKSKEITIYSNEYEGGVNPAQFWNRNAYSPRNIMDPYWE